MAPYSLLFRELREREARLDGIGQVNEAAMQSLELHELMDSVLARIMGIMEAQAALIMLRRGGRLVAVASRGFKEGLVEDFSLSLGEGVAGQVATTGKPVSISDVQSDPRIVHPILVDNGVRSLLAVPHAARGRRSSACCTSIGGNNGTSPRTMCAFSSFWPTGWPWPSSTRTSIAGRRRWPRPCKGRCWCCLGSFRASASGTSTAPRPMARTWGAISTISSPEDHSRVWMVMGDVSGHGIEAAMTAALIREVTRALALEVGRPEEVLQMVNRAVVTRLDFRHFATMFLGVLDLRTGRLTYCSAGHPPGLIIGKDRGISELASRGLPVGAFPDTVYSATTVSRGPRREHLPLHGRHQRSSGSRGLLRCGEADGGP